MAIADKPRGHGHAEACELTRGDPPRRICRASPRCQPGERHRPRAMKALPKNPRTAGGCSPRHMVRRTRTGACRSAATPRARHGVRYTGRPVGVGRIVGNDDYREVLEHAPSGIFDPRSWAYWNLVCGHRPAPPLPVRIFPNKSVAPVVKRALWLPCPVTMRCRARPGRAWRSVSRCRFRKGGRRFRPGSCA